MQPQHRLRSPRGGRAAFGSRCRRRCDAAAGAQRLRQEHVAAQSRRSAPSAGRRSAVGRGRAARMYAPGTRPPRGIPTDHTARRGKLDGARCARHGPFASPRCDKAGRRPTRHAAGGATLRRGRLVVASAPYAERRTGAVGDAGAGFGARHPAAFARRTHRSLGFAREARALCPAAELGTGGKAHDHCFDARFASHLS